MKTIILKRLLVVTLIVLIQACAVVLPTETNNPVKHPFKPGEGAVVVSITSNAAQLNYVSKITLEQVLPPNYASGTKKATPTQYYLNDIKNINRDTSFLAGNLPAGEYKLVALQAPVGAPGTVSYSLRNFNTSIVGNIVVKPNQISDLGRVVLTAINLNAGIGRSKQYLDNAELIKKYLPEWTAIETHTVDSGWLEPRKDIDIAEGFATIYPIGMNAITDLEAGYVAGASRMGTMHVRTPKGFWKTVVQAPDFLPIRSIALHPDDNVRFIVGAESAKLFKINKEFEFIEIDTGNLVNGTILFIDQDKQTKRWYLGVRQEVRSADDKPPTLAVYYSDDLESGDWTVLIEASVAWSAWSGETYAWVWPRSNGLGFASTETSSVHCFDYASQAWTQYPIPNDQRLIGLTGGANDSIGVLAGKSGGFAGVFANTYYTTNCGESWVQTYSPYKVKASAPLMLADGTVLEKGGVFRDGGIYASKTPWEKEGWQKILDDSVLAESIYLTEKGDLIMISNGQWGWEAIRGSSDGGKTWTIEKSSYSQKMQDAIDGAKEN